MSRLSVSRSAVRSSSVCGAVLSAAMLLGVAGCKSAYDKQVDNAKVAAVSTGQAQQVISVEKDGKTTVTIVQPPATPGAAPGVSSTVTPGGAPLVAGQPDWSNGARPAPGNVVTFEGPKTAPAQAVTGVGPVPTGGTAASLEGSPTVPAGPGNEAGNGLGNEAGAAPVFVPTDVTIPSGTGVAIRINQTISAKHSHAGERFTGELAESVTENGKTVLPRGTRVNGVVTEAHRRGHFKGRSYLGLRLTSIAYQGKVYPVATGNLTRTKKGKGKRSAAFIGTGAGVGMLVGGVATGGVGLVIGGLAGGGLGTLLGGLTGNRDIEIPAESLVRFRLEDDLTVQPAQ